MIIMYILFSRILFETSFFLFLLKLESMIILIYFISNYYFEIWGVSIIILIIAVVEGCLGLICLIKKIRIKGKDLIQV